MANEGETVREVCDLIRIPRLDLFKTYDELADRIIAAHEREMSAVVAERDAEILRRATLEREMAAKDAEIARLKAALKPVMSFVIPYGQLSDRQCAIVIDEKKGEIRSLDEQRKIIAKTIRPKRVRVARRTYVIKGNTVKFFADTVLTASDLRNILREMGEAS